jgi:hypothetical protein
MNSINNNISIFFNEKNENDYNDENEYNDINDDITKMMDKFRDLELEVDEKSICLIDFTVNESLPVKELLKICSYYNIDKSIKKYKKPYIIDTIFYFESLPENNNIVQKRYLMWKNIYELLNDPVMKKYIIW